MPTIADAAGEAVRGQAYREWLNMALTAAAAGGGARGLLGLYDTVKGNMQRRKTLPSGQILMDVPYPAEAVSQEQRKIAASAPIALPPNRKFPSPPSFAPPQKKTPLPAPQSAPTAPTAKPKAKPQKKADASGDTSWSNAAIHAVTNPAETAKSVWDNAKGLFTGSAVHDPTAWPGYMPGAVLSLAGGGLGGYHLVDWLWNKHRKAEREGSIAKARQNYEQALLEEQVARRGKLAEDLDCLFDLFEKRGARTAPLDVAGYTIGTDLAGAMVPGILTAIYMYNRAKARAPGEIQRKAIRQRQQLLSEARPLPLYARPVSMLPHTSGENIDAAFDQEV